jgi:hypothetical protein
MLLPKLAKELGVTSDMLLTGEGLETPEVQYVPEEKRKNFDDLMLRIKVDSDDGDKVRVNLPLPLVKVFMDAGMSMESFNLGMDGQKLDLDWGKIMLMVESGVVGKLVEIESHGNLVEIVVE